MNTPCERIVLVTLHLTSAFNAVDHTILLEDIFNSTLHNTKWWFAAYLCRCSIFVEFRGQTSKVRKVRQGVPQGGVLSPALFNSYMSSIPTPPNNITLVSYADDITIPSSSIKPEQACTSINSYLSELAT